MVYTIDRGLCKAHVMRKLNAASLKISSRQFSIVMHIDINSYREHI